MPVQPVPGEVPFIDQHGRATTLRAVLDTDLPVLVNFIFTTCTTVCPIMSRGFAQLQESLGPDRDRVRLVSISIDPEVDSVVALEAYARRYQAQRRLVASDRHPRSLGLGAADLRRLSRGQDEPCARDLRTAIPRRPVGGHREDSRAARVSRVCGVTGLQLQSADRRILVGLVALAAAAGGPRPVRAAQSSPSPGSGCT